MKLVKHFPPNVGETKSKYIEQSARSTYERSKLCLLEELGRKNIHQDVLVADDEDTAISRPRE